MSDLNKIIAEIRADFADGDQLVDRMYVEMLLDEIERLRNDVQEAHDKTSEVRTAWKHLADENERLSEELDAKQDIINAVERALKG